MDDLIVCEAYPGLQEPTFNPRNAVTWIEQKPAPTQVSYALDLFEQLLQNAAKPKETSGHACIKLCGFIELCSKSNSAAVRECAFDERTAKRLFDFYVEWNEQDQHRSMRLVLDFLKLSILKNPNLQLGQAIKAMLLNDIVSFITLKSTKPAVKSAMTALDYFVQKRVFYLFEVIEVYRRLQGISTEPADLWDAFVSRLFQWMEMKNICPMAGKLLATIFSAPWHENQSDRFLPKAWHRFLCAGLKADAGLLEPIQLYTMIPLFATDKEQMIVYLDYLYSLQGLTKDQTNLDIASMIWLSALEAGKKVGVVGEPLSDETPSSTSDSITHLDSKMLEDILSHSSTEARSSAVSILIASPSTSRPYTRISLELLQKHIPAFYADGDAKFRYDVLGYSRNMIGRIIGAIAGLSKDLGRKSKKAKKTRDNGAAVEEIDKLRQLSQLHIDFLGWYLNFLKHELVPTASYQRHITALKAMEFILKSDPRTIQIESHDELHLTDTAWLRTVLDLVMDPFDDVRETAASLLTLLASRDTANPIFGLSGSMLQELEEFCLRASTLAGKTSRADHSDGVARSYEVLCQWTLRNNKLEIPARLLDNIEVKLSAAEKNLASAVLEEPIHGDFAALRYVWQSLSSSQYSSSELETLESLQSRAINCCQRIWQTVRLVLCDDSPEGHLPEELEEVDELDTKDLLSYSFRAIHESSHLLRAIANNIKQHQRGLITLGYDEFRAIGNLTFDQLSNLRHRGAFTTVSQTFTSCCQLVKYIATFPTQGSELLNDWYKGAMNCIYTQASTTRRSAGIPALIVGVLSPNLGQPSFHDVMHQLQEIARQPAHVSETDGSNLPQVHATNCIKDIFKSSMLSKRAEPYLTECLELAAGSLKSEVWAIRNCGLILLRSLIDNLFGTSESKTAMEAGWDGQTTRLAWHKYKKLPALLVTLLKSGQTTTHASTGMTKAESVFPALDIIRRAGPPQEFKDELFGDVAWYLGSHIWHVREIAARTLCSFLLQEDWLERIKSLLTSSYSSANKLHGALLTLKFLLERLLGTMPTQLLKHWPQNLHSLMDDISKTHGSFQTCVETHAVYFEIIQFVNGLAGNGKFSEKCDEIDLLTVDYVSPLIKTKHKGVPSALKESKEAQAYTAYKMETMLFMSQPHTRLNIQDMLNGDTNVACDALDTVLAYVQTRNTALFKETAVSQIMDICLTTLHVAVSPDPRTIALEILAVLFDGVMDQGMNGLLPSKAVLETLWAELQSKIMNPGLADAIIRASGPIMKAVITQSADESTEFINHRLRSWGVIIGNAGLDDKGFDTRLAGVQAIVSFTSHGVEANLSLANLPWLLALYDFLNDDDDEIRQIAASATTPITGKPLVSIEASTRLLSWLAENYGITEEFRMHVVCRMIGHLPGTAQSIHATLKGWVSADVQLTNAMRFDDSLFVIEEQNLYVDEVREALRWSSVFAVSCSAKTEDVSTTALVEWTAEGLETLNRLAEQDDGALGWTSKPEVFAICARIVVAGAALSGKDKRVRTALKKFIDKGKSTRVHGLLLAMSDAEEVVICP